MIDSEPITTADLGSIYLYTVTVRSADADSLLVASDLFTVSAPLLPEWLALEKTVDDIELLTGTPGLGDLGEHAVEIEVADAGGIVITQSFTVSVAAPPLEAAPLELTTDEDTPLVARVAATSTLGDVLTYTVEISPTSGTVTLATAIDEVSGEPLLQTAGLVDDESMMETGADLQAAGQAPELASAADLRPVPYSFHVFIAGQAPELASAADLPGLFLYLPAPDFAGEDSFAFAVSDSSGFTVTVPVTITVQAVNDTPQIDLSPVITLTRGEEVSLPVVVLDPDSDAVTVSVDVLPAGLELLDGMVMGIVAEGGGEEGGVLVSQFSADDNDGGVATAAVEWTLAAAELPGDETLPGEDGLPPVEEQPDSPLDLPDELTAPDATGDATGDVSEPVVIPAIPATAYANATPGSGPLEGYSWGRPLAFGDCPVTPDALAAQSSDADGAASAQDARALAIAGAPELEYSVNLPAAGEYVLSVCGCAPQLTLPEGTGEGTEEVAGDAPAGAAENNATVYAGFNGAPAVVDATGQMLAIGGFDGWSGYTWQSRWVDPAAGESGAVTLQAAEPGVQRIQLWMADDGLIVYSLRVAALGQADVEPGADAAACGPSLPEGEVQP